MGWFSSLQKKDFAPSWTMLVGHVIAPYVRGSRQTQATVLGFSSIVCNTRWHNHSPLYSASQAYATRSLCMHVSIPLRLSDYILSLNILERLKEFLSALAGLSKGNSHFLKIRIYPHLLQLSIFSCPFPKLVWGSWVGVMLGRDPPGQLRQV